MSNDPPITEAELFELMEHRNIRRVQPGLPIWEIEINAGFSGLIAALFSSSERNYQRTFDARRKRVLRRLIESARGDLLLTGSEDPIDDCLKGSWQPAVRRGVWVVPSDIDLDEVYQWLSPVSWTLRDADSANPDVLECRIDLMRGRLDEQLATMSRGGIRFVLDAFHDSNPWRIAIHPALISE